MIYDVLYLDRDWPEHAKPVVIFTGTLAECQQYDNMHRPGHADQWIANERVS